MAAISLYLSPTLRQALRALLVASARMENGDQVVTHLGADPWGDVGRFRSFVYEPLEHLRSSPISQDEPIRIEPRDASHLFEVLRGLSEAFAGGVPWTSLNAAEREAVQRCLRQLGDPS